MEMIPNKHKILLVCDDVNVLSTLSIYLNRSFGQRVKFSLTNSLKHSLDMCLKQNFDFIVTHNPDEAEMNNLDYLNSIRTSEHMNKNSPVMMLTKNSSDTFNKNSWSMPKPYDYEKLVDLVADNLSLAEVDSYKIAKYTLNIVAGVSRFSERILNIVAEPKEPIAKQDFDLLKGQAVFSISLEHKGCASKVLIGFESPTLAGLKKVLNQDNQSHTDELIGRAALNIIFKDVLNSIKDPSMNKIKKDYKMLSDAQILQHSKIKGVCIPISLNKTTLWLYLI